MPILVLLCLLIAVPAQARDWFVRADSSGGDGTIAKPFADPWMAFDKCEAGHCEPSTTFHNGVSLDGVTLPDMRTMRRSA